ncbi:MAG TPA: sigma-70 family RNA polymerase sigma factor [Dehalococcoidia bacterium]|nr:sigma-70 family RNA polymerase sigma factor [Dehalococcoidia bacterium]
MGFETDNQAGQDAGPPPHGRAGLTGAGDADLVEAARGLDETAWAEIYRRHARQVYAYVYYRVGDQHTAEDLAADVFVKALASIRGYAYRGTPLLAWLYRIAHNVTVDYRRTAAKRAQHHGGGPVEIEDRRDALQALDDHSDMMRAIRCLTEDQQQVVILRFYQQMSNADVAKVMGKPEGAVKALQTRALRSLRRLLVERRGAA